MLVVLTWFSRNTLDCFSRASTSVVLPWSTWAMMAMLRTSSLTTPSAEAAGSAGPGMARQVVSEVGLLHN